MSPINTALCNLGSQDAPNIPATSTAKRHGDRSTALEWQN